MIGGMNGDAFDRRIAPRCEKNGLGSTGLLRNWSMLLYERRFPCFGYSLFAAVYTLSGRRVWDLQRSE